MTVSLLFIVNETLDSICTGSNSQRNGDQNSRNPWNDIKRANVGGLMIGKQTTFFPYLVWLLGDLIQEESGNLFQ